MKWTMRTRKSGARRASAAANSSAVMGSSDAASTGFPVMASLTASMSVACSGVSPSSGAAAEATPRAITTVSAASGGVSSVTEAYLGARGMPRPIIAIRSRWISFVPPPNVKIVFARYARSSLPASTAPAVSLREVCRRPDDLHERAIRLERDLGAEDLRRGCVGGVEPRARGPRDLPVHELEELGAGMDARERRRDPLLVDDAPSVGERRRRAPTGARPRCCGGARTQGRSRPARGSAGW